MTTGLVESIGERMWTEREAAFLLHVSPNTMWLWRKQKKVTYFRLANGTIRYRKRDLDKLLNDGLCAVEDETPTLKMGEGGE